MPAHRFTSLIVSVVTLTVGGTAAYATSPNSLSPHNGDNAIARSVRIATIPWRMSSTAMRNTLSLNQTKFGPGKHLRDGLLHMTTAGVEGVLGAINLSLVPLGTFVSPVNFMLGSGLSLAALLHGYQGARSLKWSWTAGQLAKAKTVLDVPGRFSKADVNAAQKTVTLIESLAQKDQARAEARISRAEGFIANGSGPLFKVRKSLASLNRYRAQVDLGFAKSLLPESSKK